MASNANKTSLDHDDHYRVQGFIRDLDPAVLASALNNFDTVEHTDGKDYEKHTHDEANNIASILKETIFAVEEVTHGYRQKPT